MLSIFLNYSNTGFFQGVYPQCEDYLLTLAIRVISKCAMVNDRESGLAFSKHCFRPVTPLLSMK
jgi:hypothetical protein